jgi:hypothetical protein
MKPSVVTNPSAGGSQMRSRSFKVLRGCDEDLGLAADMRRPVLKNILVTTDRSLAESLRACPAEGGVLVKNEAFDRLENR